MYRLVAVSGLLLAAAGISTAQPTGVNAQAAPPDKAALDRLGLRTEWTLAVPIDGTRDTIALVQTIDDQLFVQTRAGALFAVDALTGRVQWAARLGQDTPGVPYPVAANANFVFCAYLTKLYAFYRYTGATEYVSELGTPVTAGLAADNEGVYCVLGVRPRSAGAHRIAVFDLPRPIGVTEPARGAVDPLAQSANKGTASPADELARRYAPRTVTAPAELPELNPRPRVAEAPAGGFTASRTPSLNLLPSVVPPYALGDRNLAPSLNPLPSVHQPYHLRLETGKYIQQSPSLGVIPPSLAASLLLSDLRPQAVAPPERWEYGVTSRVPYPLLLTPARVWAATDDNTLLALGKRTEYGKVMTEVSDRMSAPISAPPVAAGTTYYVPMLNGSLAAVAASGGNLAGGAAVKWRADTGGLNNHAPFVSKDRLYAAGDNSGVVCLNRDTGDILWRTDLTADRVIGASEELVYVRDRQGRFLVYDARRPTDAAGRRSAPLGSADFGAFTVHVVNTVSDRVYLAARNGLLVCLRDAAAKYARPVSLWPPPEVNRTKAIGVDSLTRDPAAGQPKKDPDPSSDPEPKNKQ